MILLSGGYKKMCVCIGILFDSVNLANVIISFFIIFNMSWNLKLSFEA